MANRKEKNTLTAVRHFRMTESDALNWDEKVDRSGMTTSEFFREAVLNNQTTVRARPVIHPLSREILHYLSKQGNNINQIARNLNLGRKAGELSERDYKTALEELHEINKTARVVMKVI